MTQHPVLNATTAGYVTQANRAALLIDMEAYFDRLAPENAAYYKHTIEGPDDMPAHLKAVLLGSSLTIPISNGRLALGTWQGVYLCEHRDDGGRRRVVVTLSGQVRTSEVPKDL